MSVQPFPFSALEVLSRGQVATAARLRRLAASVVALSAVEDALGQLVEERVEIRVRRFRPLERATTSVDALGLLLAPSGESGRFLVEAEGALGARLVTRALRQRAPRITDPSRSPAPPLLGAFAAVLTTALRRAHAGALLKVIAAGPAAALVRDLGAATTTAWLTVLVGSDAFEARVSVPDDLLAPPRAFTHSDVLALGDAGIALPLVIATTLAARAELDALSPGDAFVIGTLALDASELRGPVALVPPGGERGLGADLAADGRLVVRGRVESHPWEREMSSDERATTTTIEVLEDAPVVVRVELGTVEMKAREWAALGAGDVVALGRRVGDPAILRVGGVELARGELVQIEGEMAVRITSRAKSREGDGG